MRSPGGAKRLGFIGAGAMAEALMRGFISADMVEPHDIVAYDVAAARLAAVADDLNIIAANSAVDVVHEARIIFIAVKPQHVAPALKPCIPHVKADTVFVSLAAGVSLGRLQSLIGEETAIVRVMPNTAALVRQGVSAICGGHRAATETVDQVDTLMRSVGPTVIVEESMFDAVTGLSGSGPAYLCLIVEALADGGVAAGLPRHTALQLAAATVQGTGAMIAQQLEEGSHPALLREQVTSPGGTTAAGLAVLEQQAVRYAVAEAVRQASLRSHELSKE